MPTYLEILKLLSVGVWNTLLLTLLSAAVGVIGGTALTLAHVVTGRTGRAILRGFVYTVQSVPSLVLIFMAMFGLPQIGVCLPPMITVIGCLGLVASAYMGEVLRGALNSIDDTQREAGLSLGMSQGRVFWSVLMPQMWRLSAPGLINEFTAVLKSSPFAYIAGVPEILKEAQALTAVTSRGLPVYTIAALLFLAIYLVCNGLFETLYRRFHLPGFEEG